MANKYLFVDESDGGCDVGLASSAVAEHNGILVKDHGNGFTVTLYSRSRPIEMSYSEMAYLLRCMKMLQHEQTQSGGVGLDTDTMCMEVLDV